MIPLSCLTVTVHTACTSVKLDSSNTINPPVRKNALQGSWKHVSGTNPGGSATGQTNVVEQVPPRKVKLILVPGGSGVGVGVGMPHAKAILSTSF